LRRGDRGRWIGFERTRTKRRRRRRRRKSCGHGCTERDSGCMSTCPFSAELRRVVIYGNRGWVRRETQDARRSAVFHHERLRRVAKKLTLGIPDLEKCPRGIPRSFYESAPNYLEIYRVYRM